MANHKLTGDCRCGRVTLDVKLTSEPALYSPRACDCSFCRSHDVAYLSDPQGSMVIQTESSSTLKIAKQGDEQAEFLLCAECGTLLGARWQEGRHQYACINSRVLFEKASLGQEVTATPKQLNAGQKTERWKQLWFPVFAIMTTNA